MKLKPSELLLMNREPTLLLMHIYVECFHRGIKQIAARKQCSVQEAIYWYHVTARDGVHSTAAPANVP